MSADKASPVKVTLVQSHTKAVKVGPSWLTNLMLGALLGLLAGTTLALLRDRMDTKIRTREDVELADDELTVLGTIPFDADVPNHPIILEADPGSTRAESFRSLRTNLQFVDAAEHARVIVITASLAGEGKSTTIANLAFAIAKLGSSVCIIEGDLRRPRLLEYLGMEGGVGLTDALIGRVPLRDVVQRFGQHHLMVLGSGATPPNPSELLGSEPMKAVLEDLRGRFDYVIIDAPPLLPVTDAAVLSTTVNGTVVVSGADIVNRGQLVAALNSLDAVNANVLGLVLNRVARGTYYGYRYKYSSDTPTEQPSQSQRRLAKKTDMGHFTSNSRISRFSRREHDRLAHLGGFAVDLVLLAIAVYLAAWVRYDLSAGETVVTTVLAFAGVVVYVYAVAVLGFLIGPYRIGHVRGSFEETADLARVTIATGAVLVVLRFTLGQPAVPRSVPFTTTVFALMLTFAVRFFFVRSWHWARRPMREQDTPVIVLGAEYMGRQLVRSLNRDTSDGARYVPAALLDDDPTERRLSIEGLKVSGTRKHIAAEAERTGAGALIIAATTMDGEDPRDISDRARGAGLDMLTLPPVDEMFHIPRGADLRRLNLEDLLGRQRIELDQTAIRQSLSSKRVLVTGAGGSIGSELCRPIYKYGPAKLVLLDRDKSAMHSVQMSMTGRALLDDGTLALCDIRDPAALAQVFHRERPEVVFHAASLKHLMLLEQFPIEAWKTNVRETLNFLEASRDADVTTFVNVSTDKAAWLSSVLRYSKRIAERLTASFTSQGHGTYVSVRFGNVLGSRGSVITAFTTQIERGGPVTVTHPDVERFFMLVLIPEACQLVLQAAAIGEDGKVMVLAMGKPVKIVNVARNLIEMSGKQGIEIEYTGLRAGEKLSEQLFTPGEQVRPLAHPLVSHVLVPAIDPADVVLQCFRDEDVALAWMVEKSGGHRDHDPSQDIDSTAEGPQLSVTTTDTYAGEHI